MTRIERECKISRLGRNFVVADIKETENKKETSKIIKNKHDKNMK